MKKLTPLILIFFLGVNISFAQEKKNNKAMYDSLVLKAQILSQRFDRVLNNREKVDEYIAQCDKLRVRAQAVADGKIYLSDLQYKAFKDSITATIKKFPEMQKLKIAYTEELTKIENDISSTQKAIDAFKN